jgi:large subunit ribosomal protein L25
MSELYKLSAEPRERVGKGAARAARRAGRVPGVIYGAKKAPVLITVDPGDLRREITGGGFFSKLFDVDVGGSNERVLPRDLQLHPVTDRPIHVDFLRVSRDTRLDVMVRVVFLNEEESPGLKRGGVLNIVRHEVELSCRAEAIPSQIEIDLTGRDIGDSAHISDVTLPEGVEPTITDRDFTIATIAAPSVVREEAAEVAEGEVPEGEVPEGEVPEGAEGAPGEGAEEKKAEE